MRVAGSLVACVVATAAACSQAILTAPTGATLTLSVNPTFIAANGGVAVVSALVIEPAGTPVPDGTVVQFFTTLGEIEEQGRTNDGVARVNLVAGSQSGVATVTAFSGGVSAESGVDVTIGAARIAAIVVTPDPIRITRTGDVRLVANVFDENGNAIADVPIIFTAATGATDIEFAIESGSAPIFTDNNGRAVDFLVVTDLGDESQETVTITATASNGVTGTATVTVN